MGITLLDLQAKQVLSFCSNHHLGPFYSILLKTFWISHSYTYLHPKQGHGSASRTTVPFSTVHAHHLPELPLGLMYKLLNEPIQT